MDQEDFHEKDGLNLKFHHDEQIQVEPCGIETIHPFAENSCTSNAPGSSAEFIFHELAGRHASMSNLSSCEASLDTLLELMLQKNIDDFNLDVLSEHSLDTITLMLVYCSHRQLLFK